MHTPFQRSHTMGSEALNQTNVSGLSKATTHHSTKAYAFELNNDVQDSYGAYRLNSNMGLSIASSPKKIRQGFFGETHVYDDSPTFSHKESFDTQSPNSPMLSPSKWRTYIKKNPFHNPSRSVQLDQSGHSVHDSSNLLPSINGKPRPHHKLSPIERLFANQTQQLEKLAQAILDQDDDLSTDLNSEYDMSQYKPSRPKQNYPMHSRQGSVGDSPVNKNIKSRILMKMRSMNNSPTIPIQEELTPRTSIALSKKPDVSPKRMGHVTFDTTKKVVKSKLKAVLWVCAYPFLLRKKMNDKILVKKRKQDITTSKQVIQYGVSILEFIQKHCLVPLTKLYKETKPLILINEDKEDDTEISRKENQRRVVIILGRLIEVAEALRDAISEENLPKPFLGFFANILQDNTILPRRFLTDYEASRMEFTTYGTLKNMHPLKCKMICGMFVIAKGLIHVFLNQPWTFLANIKETPHLAKNLRNCSSAMYTVFMDIFKDSLPVIKNNQFAIEADKKIKTQRYPPAAHNLNPEDNSRPSLEELRSEVITGLCSKKNMRDCFIGQSDLVKELRGVLEDCLERLYNVIYQVQAKRMKH